MIFLLKISIFMVFVICEGESVLIVISYTYNKKTRLIKGSVKT